MQFKVTGTHRETGQHMAVTIDAPTPSAAEEQANSMNMVVERVDVAVNGSPVRNPSWNPGVAAVLSLIIPGSGQMYKGQLYYGFWWLLMVPFGYLIFIVPGIILHIICVYGAYSCTPRNPGH